MKKFLAMIVTALAIVVGGNILVATPAHSAPVSTSVSAVVTEVPTAKTLLHVDALAPSAISAPHLIGVGGGVQPAWRYVSCYWAMNGAQYCWRYSCTYFERVALGCYDGWYRTTLWYA